MRPRYQAAAYWVFVSSAALEAKATHMATHTSVSTAHAWRLACSRVVLPYCHSTLAWRPGARLSFMNTIPLKEMKAIISSCRRTWYACYHGASFRKHPGIQSALGIPAISFRQSPEYFSFDPKLRDVCNLACTVILACERAHAVLLARHGGD